MTGTDYRDIPQNGLRVLLCIGVTQAFFDSPKEEIAQVTEASKAAFSDLSGRFGVTVLGTMDDDETMVGSSTEYPWTAYILLDAPHRQAIVDICDLVRATPVGSHQLWRYMRIEARIGRPLFFGTA